jgi:hypothetical protein
MGSRNKAIVFVLILHLLPKTLPFISIAKKEMGGQQPLWEDIHSP